MKAHVDLETGKIYGCKKHSFLWWHEKGHIEFNDHPQWSFLILIRGYIFQLCFGLTVWGIYYEPLFLPAIITWIAFAFLGVFEELWCNNYALKRLRNHKV